MKSILFALIASLLLFSVAHAAPVSWDFSGGVLRPLQSMWTNEVRVPWITATSTTATSTFPILSSNRIYLGGNMTATGTIGATSITSTNASTTFATSTSLTTSLLRILSLSDGCLNVTGGLVGSTGSACGSGGSGGSGTIGTSTTPVIGNLSYWTGLNTLGTVATGTISESVPGITVSATRAAVGGALDFGLESGFVIPTTTRALNWDTAFSWGNHALQNYLTVISTSTVRGMFSETVPGLTYTSSTGVLSLDGGFTIPTTTLLSDLSNFFITPSSRITAGSGLQWSTNTLNCVTATGSVFGCLTAADWTIFNQKVSSTSIDTSAELRSLVTDETGTGALMFGITSAMSDDISCGPSQVLARNSGDSAWECVPMTGGGGGGGIATTTDNNAEVGETISFLNTDLYIGGSASNTAEFNFDKDAARFTLSSTTANATATITGLGGGVRLASPTENVEFNLNLADTLRLFSGTGVSAFDFGALRASGTALTFTNATATTFTTNALRILGLSDGCLNVTGGAVGSTGVACGSGSGGGGTISTSTTPVIGQMAYWTGLNALGTIATGSLTDSVNGLTLSATRSLIGGAADLSLDSGFVIPTTTRAAIWDTAISDGNTGWDNIYGLITANTATLTVTNATTTNATTTNLRFTNATGVNATTTNLGISVMHGLSSAGIIFLANSGTQVADFGAGGGSNATFNGGVNINGQATIPILLGTNATITNATSTSLFSTTASTSNFWGAGLAACTGASNKVTWNNGRFSCETDQTGAGGSPGGTDGLVQYNNSGVFAGASNMFYDDGTNRLGLGTTTPAELLHLFTSPGNFTTMRVDSGLTRGYMYAFDGDNSFNLGTVSDSLFNFKQNNQTVGYINPDGRWVFQEPSPSPRTIVEVKAPDGDPQEATVALQLPKGGGNMYFLDLTIEDYNGYDRMVSFNSAATGTIKPLPMAFRGWQANTGVVAERGVYWMILHPSGSVNLGVSSTSIATNTLLYGGTTTAPFIARLFGSGNNERLTLRGTGELGLGSTSPSRRLTVQGGDFYLGGNMTATGTIDTVGLIATNATTTNATTTNLRFTTATGVSATTTNFFTTNASTSNFWGAGLLNCTGTSNKVTWSNGRFSCETDQTGGGGGSSKWTDAGLFTYLTDIADDIVFGAATTGAAPFWWDVSATTSYIGNGGSGDSVITFGATGNEWTLGFDDTDDSFRIASSTILGGLSDFFRLNSTTSILISSSSLASADRGARMTFGLNGSIGQDGRTDTLDHVVLAGRVRQTEWYNYECPVSVGATQIVADGVIGCHGYSFYEDGTETLTAVGSGGFTYGQLGGALANGGAGVFANGTSAGWLTLGTSTPVFETKARIGTIVANSTTTAYYIGFANITTGGTAYETAPSAGCFFTASSTQANWRAVCQTALGTATNIDTGVPSTTISTGGGQWRTFRIEATGNRARFFIRQGPAGVLQEVASITNTIPATINMNAGIWWGRTFGTQAIQFDFADTFFAARRIAPPSI